MSLFRFLINTGIIVIFCGGILSETRGKASSTGVILADSHGKIIYSKNKNARLIPASILKVLTSLAALDKLGEDYRFKTLFAFDPKSCDLYIKGLGDPLFISEAARMMCRQIIRTTGTTRIRHIILDTSFFHPDIRIPGAGRSLNPYDAVTGALCANFNTIAFKRDPVTRNYISAERQTPLVKQFLPQIKLSGLNEGRIRLHQDQAMQYPGFLLKALFNELNIEVIGDIRFGVFRQADTVCGVFTSAFTLSQVVQKLLKYSNNFMANQLMLTMTATAGVPARVDAGVYGLKKYAKKLGIERIDIVEGSGLSRKNRISPAQMLKILMAFMPYHDLLKAGDREFYKTGTLNAVRSRAGYLKGSNRKLYPFVIMVNLPGKGVSGIKKMLSTKVAAQ